MALPGEWKLQDLIFLTYLKGINTPRIFKILEFNQSLAEFKESKLWKSLYGSTLFDDISILHDEAEKQIEWTIQSNSKIITFWDDDYPYLLQKIAYPPFLLFVKGTLKSQDNPCIAIVGTRKATSYGKITAERFSEFFAANGITVISGLAHGIDTISHLSVVKSGGTTYAVIACGLDCISPSLSQKNAEKIVDFGGAIISEYKFGVQANLGSFPQRNRIIAGISLATIVIECGKKSGALITARMALEESRDVFAVPGNINSKLSEGTNLLIKNNSAVIALSPESVLEDLGLKKVISERREENHGLKFDDKIEEHLYNILTFEPIHIDIISDLSELDMSEVNAKLLMLEFKGLIKQIPGKYYLRTHI